MGKLTCVVWEDEFPGCCWSCCLSGVQAVPLSVSSLISTLGLLAKAKQCLECTTIASVTVALLTSSAENPYSISATSHCRKNYPYLKLCITLGEFLSAATKTQSLFCLKILFP